MSSWTMSDCTKVSLGLWAVATRLTSLSVKGKLFFSVPPGTGHLEMTQKWKKLNDTAMLLKWNNETRFLLQ